VSVESLFLYVSRPSLFNGKNPFLFFLECLRRAYMLGRTHAVLLFTLLLLILLTLLACLGRVHVLLYNPREVFVFDEEGL
jgi:hypothetical protein